MDLHKSMRQFWEIEEISVSRPLSVEEKWCNDHFVEKHSRDPSGLVMSFACHFAKVESLFSANPNLPRHCLLALERRLCRQNDDARAYRDFMLDYERRNHMQPRTSAAVQMPEPHFLPHHEVKKESSTTTKLRVVFNASSKSANRTSLNDHLLIGPKLQAELSSIILQWRSFRFVMCSDIAQMYRQILVDPRDRDFQCILWRARPDLPIVTYQLNTVTFGVSSSPYLALRVLKQLALDDGHLFPLAAPVLESGLYVDDCLFGADDIEKARTIRDQLIALLRRGGFDLRKWAGNHPDLMEGIDPTDHGHALDKPFDTDQSLKVLGVYWNPGNDSFQFRTLLPRLARHTKRNLLSQIARLFDPLGWVSPIVVKAKILMQRLWTMSVDWNDDVPVETRLEWEHLFEEFPLLTDILLPRWTGQCSTSRDVELHAFSDATTLAYAAAVYIRVVSPTGDATVNLLIGKSKVAPLKPCSIPRLELCAALLLARLVARVRLVNTFKSVPEYCWSDSMIVIHWLRRDPAQWKTFVANRTAEIKSLLPEVDWRPVPSGDNPADLASRGCLPSELVDRQLWWRGPEWLSLSHASWPAYLLSCDAIPSASLEVRAHVIADVSVINETLQRVADRVSVWSRMKRVVAYALSWLHRIRCRDIGCAHLQELPVSCLDRAEIIWFRWLQRMQFLAEVQALSAHDEIPRKSALLSLPPFMDANGLIRVGGRLDPTIVGWNTAHPIVLKTHPVVVRMVRHAHVRSLHGSLSLTLSTLRQSVWILQAKKIVRSVIFHCVICSRLKAVSARQLMGQLPASRISRPARPFSNCGIDYAGPIQLRLHRGRGAKTCHAYIALFVCFAVKAVHLEVVSNYSADAFLAALKRFAARRSIPANMYSDCGTTFVGANRELQMLFRTSLQRARDSRH